MTNYFLPAMMLVVAVLPERMSAQDVYENPAENPTESTSFDVLYVNGSAGQIVNGVEISGWDVETPVEVNAVDGKFTVEVSNIDNIGFSTQKGDWPSWNEGQYCVVGWDNNVDPNAGYYSDTNSPVKFVGTIVALEQKSSAMKAPVGMAGGTYTFVFDKDMNTVWIQPHTLYIAGASNMEINGVALASWDIANPAVVELEEGQFKFEVNVSSTRNFDISVTSGTTSPTRSWEFYNAGMFSANPVIIGDVTALKHSPSGTYFPQDATGRYSIVIPADLSTISVKKIYKTLYVNGATGQTFNGEDSPGWVITTPVEIPVNDEEKFILTIDNLNSFGLSTLKCDNESDWGNWDSHQVGVSKTEHVRLLVPFTPITGQSAAFTKDNAEGMFGGKYTIEVSNDLSEMEIYPNYIYIAGPSTTTIDNKPLSWNIVNPTTIGLNADGIFVFEIWVKNSESRNIDISVFNGVSDSNWNLWWNPGKYSAIITTDDIDKNVTFTNSSEGLYFPTEGKYTVFIPSDMKTVMVKKDFVSGMEESIVKVESECEYYNLQGMKVSRPERGIYIVKRGSKSVKQIFR